MLPLDRTADAPTKLLCSPPPVRENILGDATLPQRCYQGPNRFAPFSRIYTKNQDGYETPQISLSNSWHT